MPARTQVLARQPRDPPRGSLIGHCETQYPSGTIVRSVGVHLAGSKQWCTPPARPWIRDGRVVFEERHKARHEDLPGFASHGVRNSWSQVGLRVLLDAHPGAFDRGEGP
jgi:hypothetical protein